jgi:DNA excision repair protein ERCC-4
VLEEIEEERQRLKLEKAEEGPSEIRGEEEEDAVLVACKDERMCLQLQEVVRHGPQKVNLALGLLRSFLYPLLC